MRLPALLSLATLVASAGCLGPSAELEASPVPDPLPPSDEWSVVGHLWPAGALDVRFTVAAPTTCRMAGLVHHVPGGGEDKRPHMDFWVDGESLPAPFGIAGYSLVYTNRAKAGPVDGRMAFDAFSQAYADATYGEGATFASGLGLADVEVHGNGRIVLSAPDGLVDAPEAVNLAIGGSMLASVECGSDVSLSVREDADAIWTNAVILGGDLAVQAPLFGAEQGSLDFHGDGEGIELLLGSWGGVQGSLSFGGALEHEEAFATLPREAGGETTLASGPGDVHVAWDTVRPEGLWWIGLSSWERSTAAVEARGRYPFD